MNAEEIWGKLEIYNFCVMDSRLRNLPRSDGMR